MIAPSPFGTGPRPLREFRAFVAIVVGLQIFWVADAALLALHLLGDLPMGLVPSLAVVAVSALLFGVTFVAPLQGILVLTLLFTVSTVFGVLVGSVTLLVPNLLGMLLGLRAALSPPESS